MINFLKTHYIAVIGAVIVAVIFIYGGWQACQTAKFNRQVNTQTNQANKAVQQAANSLLEAVNADIERRAEDAVREKVIQPKLETVRKTSRGSQVAIETARKTYHEQKSNTENLSSADADNCRKLGELFPNIDFEECRKK